MRNAREGHSVTYLQSKEVPAGIHINYPRAPTTDDRGGTGSPPRGDRDKQIPKPALRIEVMQEVL